MRTYVDSFLKKKKTIERMHSKAVDAGKRADGESEGPRVSVRDQSGWVGLRNGLNPRTNRTRVRV